MADAVTTIITNNGPLNYQARFTNISDGTGESAVVKISKAGLVNELGVQPRELDIVRIQWSIQGFTSVRVLWDHTTDDLAQVLAAGNGFRDYADSNELADPRSVGGTGDILFTTAGGVSGATYDILLWVKKSGNI